MCGVAGIFNIVPQEINSSKILKMQNLLLRRGPDGCGVYKTHDMALIHQRLAIVDPHPSSNQPMIDSETNSVICYNGEIYNYKQLRKELEQDSVFFKTVSDTEVLLKGLVKYGMTFLDRITEILLLHIGTRLVEVYIWCEIVLV